MIKIAVKTKKSTTAEMASAEYDKQNAQEIVTLLVLARVKTNCFFVCFKQVV